MADDLADDDGLASTDAETGFLELPLGASTRRWWVYLLAGVLVVGLTGLRAIHLSADTPLDGASGTYAVHVDEGYKSFSARNFVLFGDWHWTPRDGYIGWVRGSPLTQWFHVFVFSKRFPDLIAVRVLALVGFFWLAVFTAVVLFRRHSVPIAATCLVLLGLSSPLYFYTRISLFEPILAACVCCTLAVVACGGNGKYVRALFGVGVLFLLASYGIKRSALLYFLPVFLGVFAGLTEEQWRKRRGVVLLVGGSMAFAAMGFLFRFRMVWVERLGVTPIEYVQKVLFNPLSTEVAFLMSAAALAMLHMGVVEGRGLLGDQYRAVLFSLIVVGPALIALFYYNPPRYYVPFIPALALVVAEWFAWRGWKRPLPSRAGAVGTSFAVGALVVAILAMMQGVNLALFERLELPLGDEPGISPRFVFRAGIGPALAVACGLWAWRRKLLKPTWLAAAIVVSCIGHVAWSLEKDIRFWIAPTYEGVELAEALAETLPADARIAGDWAPMAVIGTGLRALYVAPAANPSSKVLEIRPDYFMSSGNIRDVQMLREIGELGVEIWDPVLRRPYAGHEIEVLPLRYPEAEP